MFSLVEIPKLLAALALGISVAGPVAYFQGKAHQRQAMAVEALESSARKARLMRKSLLLMLPICAALTACRSTKSASVCDGFKPLRPKLETTVYILQNDRPFANDVAAHNRLLSSLGCGK
ncbi:hypothetical protein [Sinorhizobium meliloti]